MLQADNTPVHALASLRRKSGLLHAVGRQWNPRQIMFADLVSGAVWFVIVISLRLRGLQVRKYLTSHIPYFHDFNYTLDNGYEIVMVLMTKSHFTQVPSMSSPQPLQEIGQAAGEGDAVALYTIKWSDSTEGIRVSR